MYRQTTSIDPLHEPRTALRVSIYDVREKLAAVSDAPILTCDIPSPILCTPVRHAELLDVVEDIARHAPLIARYSCHRWRVTTPPLDTAWAARVRSRLPLVAAAATTLIAQTRAVAEAVGTPTPGSLAQVDTLIAYAERYPALCAAARHLGDVYLPSLYDLDLPALYQCLAAGPRAWHRRLPGTAYAAAITAVKEQAWPSWRHELPAHEIVRDVRGALAVAAMRRMAQRRASLGRAEFGATTEQLVSLLDAVPCGADQPDIAAALGGVVTARDDLRDGLRELGAALDLCAALVDGQTVEDASLATVATWLRDLADHGDELAEIEQVERLRRQVAAEGLEPFLDAVLARATMGVALTPQAIFGGFERCFYQRWLADAQ